MRDGQTKEGGKEGAASLSPSFSTLYLAGETLNDGRRCWKGRDDGAAQLAAEEEMRGGEAAVWVIGSFSICGWNSA